MAVPETPESFTEALAALIKTTMEAMGEARNAPFEIEAFFEYTETQDETTYELTPRVKIIKK